MQKLSVRRQKTNIENMMQVDPENVNSYFIDSVPDVEVDDDILSFYKTNIICKNKFYFKPVSIKLVSEIITSIKSNATGLDGINAHMLKLCCPCITPFVTHIINSCIIENVFPACWKNALIFPIPKISNPTECKDLRPISILPTLSKVLEKVMHKQLYEFLITNNLIPYSQSGFRPIHSCTTALLQVTDDLLRAYDGGHDSALILLDFSKAFDTLNHNLLLHILTYLGASHEASLLLSSFLGNRSQCVRISDMFSSFRSVSKGVPQGSVLGPLLFILYTIKFHSLVQNCGIHMYADDMQVYHSFDSANIDKVIVDINTDINLIADFSKKHALIINPKKSFCLLIGKNIEGANPNFKIGNQSLPCVKNVKNLGLHMDGIFRFRQHISTLIQKAYMNLKLIFPHRFYFNKKLKTTLCESLVLSQFSHCVPVFSPCLDYDTMRRIQRVQNSCIRLIHGIRKFDHISHTLSVTRWLNMTNRFYLLTATFYHKIIMQKLPTYLFNKIKFRTDVHHLNLRHRGLITPPLHRTTMYERSFSYNISKIYNSLCPDMKCLPPGKFKAALFQNLLNRQ